MERNKQNRADLFAFEMRAMRQGFRRAVGLVVSIFLLCQLFITTVVNGQGNFTYLYPLSIPAYNYIDSSVNIGYSIANIRADTVHSISISYTVNGGPRVSATIKTFIIGGSQQVLLTHPVPLKIHTPGDYVIFATIDSVDHEVSSVVHFDSVTTYTHFYAASPKLHRKVVFEEFTGAWCGHCSGGAYNMQSILASDTDFILVSAHQGDSMETSEGLDIHDNFTGYPGVMINRSVFGVTLRNYYPNVGSTVPIIKDLASGSKNTPSPANVSITNLVYDTNTRLMAVDVNAEFLATISHGDFRVNLTILEDSIIHPGIKLNDLGWNQNNYYFSHLSPTIDDSIPALFNLPQTLLNDGTPSGWAHNHTLRKMLGGAWGDKGVIPIHPIADSTYTKHYTFTIPEAWQARQLSLVGMVQEFHALNTSNQPVNWSNPDVILNAVNRPLFPKKQTTGGSGISNAQVAKVRIYPNPGNGTITIEGINNQATTLRICDMSGRTLFEPTLPFGRSTLHLDLPAGIYQLILLGPGTIQNEKLVIMK